jgi:hypothetical protein
MTRHSGGPARPNYTLVLSVAIVLALCTAFFAGDGADLARAAGGVVMYEADHGRFPRGGKLQSTDGTTFNSNPAVALESMELRHSPGPDGSVPVPPLGGSLQVDSFFDIFVDFTYGPVSEPFGFVSPDVQVAFSIENQTNPGVEGKYRTEILELALTGQASLFGGPPVPVVIRESPTLPSLGQHSITKLSDGVYRIDSFFDVFAEISINGAPFEPASSSFRLELTSIPEPGTLWLLAFGALTAGMWRWRRSRAA